MINEIYKLMEYMGFGNIFAILCLIIAFYFQFKNFFRLTYSIERICKTCTKLSNWRDNNTKFTSRVIFYNNGIKTLEKGEIKNLSISSLSGKIESFRIINGENIKVKKVKKGLSLSFDHLDSKENFVLEIEHEGVINVEGRISETGKILDTEPKYWLWFNAIIMSAIFIIMMYYTYLILDSNIFELEYLFNFISLFIVMLLMRFVHGMLFIPDKLKSKYLDAKDKWDNAFKNEF